MRSEQIDSLGCARRNKLAFRNSNVANIVEKKQVWLVAEQSVMEPRLGGRVLGALTEFNLQDLQITRRLSQCEYDTECVSFMQRHRELQACG